MMKISNRKDREGREKEVERSGSFEGQIMFVSFIFIINSEQIHSTTGVEIPIVVFDDDCFH